MEYFRLEQDKRIPYAIQIHKMSLIQGFLDARKGDLRYLKDMNVVYTNSNQYNWYPDVLDQQLYLVKDSVKYVISLFEPNMVYREFCILEKGSNRYERYFAPNIRLVDCLSEMSDFNPDKSVIHKIVVRAEQIENGLQIFRVDNINTSAVLVSLEVAESLLRRNPTGIRLLHVEKEKQNQ